MSDESHIRRCAIQNFEGLRMIQQLLEQNLHLGLLHWLN
jgi:hypothetical protein